MKTMVFGHNCQDWLTESSSFKQDLVASGLSLVTGMTDSPQVAICFNWFPKASRILRQLQNLGIPSVLVVTEPSVIIPGNSRDSVHKQFSTVLELGRPKGSNTIPYPLEWNMDFFSASQRVERVVSITANKYSFIPGELYSLRRLCYKSLRNLDLYGQRWNTGSLNLLALICKEAAYALVRNQNICLKDADKLFLMPKNYCGPIDNKLEILSRYKVSLVVENSIEYMSEKLMHSLLAGTIPVYVGPNPKEFGIPGDIVFHAKPTLSDIEKKISEAMDARSDWWNEAALEFLSKREVKKAWSGQAANRRIIDEALRLSN